MLGRERQRGILGLALGLHGHDPVGVKLALALQVLGGERQAGAQQSRFLVQVRLGRFHGGEPLGQAVGLTGLQLFLPAPHGEQAVAPAAQAAHDRLARVAEGFGLQFGRERQQRRPARDPVALAHVQLHQHAGLRGEHAHQTRLGDQQATHARGARVARAHEQAEQAHRGQREDRHGRVRTARGEQHRAQPCGLLLGRRLGAEQRGVRAGGGRRGASLRRHTPSPRSTARPRV